MRGDGMGTHAPSTGWAGVGRPSCAVTLELVPGWTSQVWLSLASVAQCLSIDL